MDIYDLLKQHKTVTATNGDKTVVFIPEYNPPLNFVVGYTVKTEDGTTIIAYRKQFVGRNAFNSMVYDYTVVEYK